MGDDIEEAQELTVEAPAGGGNIGLFKGKIGLFKGNIGLFPGDIGLFWPT